MHDRSGQVLAVAILFFILCWATVSMRIYTRAVMLRTVGLDDKLMVVLLAIFTAYLITQIKGVEYGTGRHRSELSYHDTRQALMWWYVCELLYIPSTCLLKITVGVSLLRISIRPLHIWTIRILMLGTLLFGTTYFFLVVFQCRPVHTFWDLSPREPGACFSDPVVLVMTYIASVINCVADWAFGTLPIFVVWSLNLPKKTRILVACILGFAAIGSTATIVRAAYIPTLLDGENFLWSTTDVAIWSTVEPGVGITAACLATLRPLWQVVRYRAGLSREVPSNVIWRERHQTDSGPGFCYGISDGRDTRAASRMQALRLGNAADPSRLSDEEQTTPTPGMQRSRHHSHSLSKSSSQRTYSGNNKTIEMSVSRSCNADDDDEELVSRPDAGDSCQSDRRSSLSSSSASIGRDGVLDLERAEPPGADTTVESSVPPSLRWSTPRLSRMSMGLSTDQQESKGS